MLVSNKAKQITFTANNTMPTSPHSFHIPIGSTHIFPLLPNRIHVIARGHDLPLVMPRTEDGEIYINERILISLFFFVIFGV
jgi:hypothetical protein